ncbi:MAG: NRDE family protein, partial [Pseudomonadota bacterium]|nr:NRDE family protein [Pseudomonadota bacterium]
MCTLILLLRPDHDWPLLLAANRDEMIDRPWLPPGHHWPGQPDVVAGIDRVGGGSWLGLNSDGLVAAIMNRHGTLGPQAGMHSRGELVFKALGYDSATVAVAALAALSSVSYRSFNL